MTLWGTYFDAARRYGDFSGRTTRAQLFGYIACTAILLFAAAVADRALLGRSGAGAILILTALGHVVPTLAVSVRRVHDADSPAAVLLIGLIPYLGWFIVFLMLIAPPSPLENRYGANPDTHSKVVTRVSRAERVGRGVTRLLKGIGAKSSPRPVVPLPEPPEALARELGLAPAAPQPEELMKREHLEMLRSRGILSEAEFIRLIRVL